MNHYLKTDSKPFQAVLDGIKSFEFRRNDRNFKVNDRLILKEINEDKVFTGRSCDVQVNYLLENKYGVPDGYCVMSITRPLSWR